MNPKDTNSSDGDRILEIEDPQIVKLAKLVLLLVDKKATTEVKLQGIKSSIADGVISQDDAFRLLLDQSELDDFV